MKIINLTKGFSTIVDNEDFEFLSQWKWHYRKCDKSGYAVRVPYKQMAIYMHRFITNSPERMEVDHINGNSLDNRKLNLRICTRQQNMQNSKVKTGSKSIYKGVNPQGKKWMAIIQRKYLGTFNSEIEAAKEYNKEAIKRYGQFAKLNII